MDIKVVVLTLMGPDRPGLVEAVSQCVARHGGNWEESRMAHLGGQFVGLLRVTVPASAQDGLENALRELGSHGLHVHSLAEPQTPGSDGGRRLRVEVTAHDREGIVRDISAIVAGRQVNVEELSTRCESAAMSGDALFRAELLLRLPESIDDPSEMLRELRTQLEAIGDDLMVDLTLL